MSGHLTNNLRSNPPEAIAGIGYSSKEFPAANLNLMEYSRRIYSTAFSAGLRPDENLQVSEWADRYRYLSSVSSAESGLWRTSRVPYLKQIMDSLGSRHPAQKVILQKGAQLGATEAGNNWIGCMMDTAPGPMMMVLPNDRMCERTSKVRINPMIDHCERLRVKVRGEDNKGKSDTILTKEFPGGVLVLVSAKSSANLRMMAIRYGFGDEVDAYPPDVRGEGSAIELMEARTRTYQTRKKLFLTSSPTIKNHSAIEREFLQTDQNYYHVPCPHCQHKQKLVFANLKYEKDEKGQEVTEAYYVCESCGGRIDEHHKTWMLENGEWIPAKPNSNEKIVGFHLNSLYSPVGWLSWLEIARKWREAQNDIDKLKVFVNTILGETWEVRGEAPAWETIYRRREKYKIGTVPMGGLFLTAGADVQKDRIEIEVTAWGRDKQSWSIDYQVIMGDTSTLEPWRQLDQYLEYQFPHECGLSLSILRLGIDSGYNTQEVYSYCRKYNDTLRVMATKGQESLQTPLGQPKAVELSLGGKKMARALKLWLIGTSILKSELYRNLRQDSPLDEEQPYPYGYCHFPEYGEEYFKQLTAEELVPIENRRGYVHSEWQKKRERNEALDCRIIARAMAASLGYDRMGEKQFAILEKQLGAQPVTATGPTAASSPSSPITGIGTPARRRQIRSKGLLN